MTKIAVCANHSFPHCGGTEKVLQLISESMANKFGHEVHVISKSLKKPITHNSVRYHTLPKTYFDFVQKVKKLGIEHLLVYSDYFMYWRDMLFSSELLPCKISISLVGMNSMLSSQAMTRIFREKKDKFTVITHSDNYQDFSRCQSLDIPVNVIHNGVDFNEFKRTNINFRSKYGIKDSKKIILCVSNFFPGKGQEYLVKVLERIENKDFVAVFICSTVNFMLAQILSNNMQSLLRASKIKHKFLQDIPREDTIAAFMQSDVFAFPSQKEVAPIVILECMASKLPWVAMAVGNIPQLKGGMQVPYRGKNKEGFAVYDDLSYDIFTTHLSTFLLDEKINKEYGQAGYDDAYENYNWEKIADSYNEIFTL